mgnify:CR=1 FL=1
MNRVMILEKKSNIFVYDLLKLKKHKYNVR